jgi:hypothetical protein
MRPGIGLNVLSEADDDGLFQFEINISNGRTSAALEFWGYADNFAQFGSGLTDFPKTIRDKVTYELGGEDKGDQRWAYYLLLEAFCYDATGQSAIKVKVDNKFDIPTYESHEFFIKSEPASINRLGQGLEKWNPVDSKEFEWTSNE